MEKIYSGYAYICLYLALIYAVTILATKGVLIYSLKNSLIDKPGERSSHSTPTPRGGGLPISILILFTVFIFTLTGFIPQNYAIALSFGGLLVSIVGWVDDHRDISAGLRGILYFLASMIALYFIGGLDKIIIGDLVLHVGFFWGSVIAIIGITWITNLYNFMDGADAIASVQAITAGLFAGILFSINNQHGMSIVCFTIITACGAFLFWNWPPARIFMGDVGSCMIGYTFGVVTIIGEVTNSVHIYIWIILLSVFIGDATFTLVKRVISGDKWYTAHRSHGYQKLIQLGVSHSILAIYLLLFNICILWPIAFIAYKWKFLSIYMVLLSIILVFILWSVIQFRSRKLAI